MQRAYVNRRAILEVYFYLHVVYSSVGKMQQKKYREYGGFDAEMFAEFS